MMWSSANASWNILVMSSISSGPAGCIVNDMVEQSRLAFTVLWSSKTVCQERRVLLYIQRLL